MHHSGPDDLNAEGTFISEECQFEACNLYRYALSPAHRVLLGLRGRRWSLLFDLTAERSKTLSICRFPTGMKQSSRLWRYPRLQRSHR